LTHVSAAIHRERDHARAQLLAKGTVVELTRLAAKLQKIAASLKTEEGASVSRPAAGRGWTWAADARVARRAATLRSAIADAGAVYLPERLHVVRIAVKKLRYALEVTADVAAIKVTPDIRELRRVQETLGRLHDLQVLIDRIRQVQASLTPPDLTVWRDLDTLVAALEDDCRRLHGRYMRDRDRLVEICQRLGGADHQEVRRQKLEGRS